MTYRLPIPEDIKTLLRELPLEPNKTLPPTWNNFVVVSIAQRCFYASVSKDPVGYEDSIRKRINPRWDNTAISLRKLLERDSAYQFFVLPKLARPEIEQWLISLGFRRIVTKMGEGAHAVSVCFKVYSHHNRLTRFVSAPADTCELDVIKQANKSLEIWLASQTKSKAALRQSIRTATRSTAHKANAEVFEMSSLVTKTSLLDRAKTSEYRAIIRENNLKALEGFVLNTTF